MTRRLDEFLEANAQDIVGHWLEEVQGGLHGDAMPTAELVDHLPRILRDFIIALRKREAPEASPTAVLHGEQRLRLGFSLPSVVREYGILYRIIVESGRRAGVPIQAADYDVLSESTNTAIADAVGQYARQRDAEVQRQANEHFAFIAHELRNPMMTARLALAYLDAEKPPGSHVLDVLRRSIARMHELIEQTLTVSRIGAGVDLRLENGSLRALLDEAETDIELAAADKHVRVAVDVEGPDDVRIDRRLIRSAVDNLLQNAVKFSPVDGSIELRAEVRGQLATIECQDQCGGLPEGFAERAFAPFVQVGKRDERGFGVGLAIAKQAVDAHGGTMRIQNLPGKGCVFVLELPVAPRSET